MWVDKLPRISHHSPHRPSLESAPDAKRINAGFRVGWSMVSCVGFSWAPQWESL